MSESPSTDRYAITQWESTSAEPSLLSKYRSLQAINAALEVALEECQDVLVDCFGDTYEPAAHDAIDRARAALSKARGGK